MKEIKKVDSINVTGYVFGVWDSVPLSEEETACKPFMIIVEDQEFLPIFSTKEKLDECLEFTGEVGEVKVKYIQNGAEFLGSVLGTIRVAVDPWITPEGKTRFVELKYD